MDQPVKTRPSPREMEARIEQAMAADRHRLTASLRRVQDLARRKQPFDRNLDRLIREVDESVERRKRRQERLPRPSFPEDLPISARRDEIARAIREHQVVVVAGETGSGKSTQLPKILLDLGYGVDGLIGHTQPRRLAARSLARRISDELGSRLGGHVGYKVRFTDETGPDTYVKLMTDGILLAELGQDRFLSAYQAIIIDEAHERSLNIDFLLGYLKQLLPRRRDLKLIITSATINPQQFAHHFRDERGGPSPVIEVSGRVYPVDVRYRPITVTEATEEGEATRILSDPDERKVQQAIASGIDEVGQVDSGDVLVFLPTERDIRETAKYLRSAASGFAGRNIDILPLYARLTPAEQDRVFSPSGGDRKRVVLATNVAETSLTVPGIRHVIDTGTARISRYAARSGVQRLPIEPVSQASADQRKGRCGRLAPGVCIRLYSEGDYAARERYTPPEILRTNLASVILQMKAMRLGDVRSFPFVEPPKPAAIRDGYDTLFELGAIDDTGELTPLGRKLAQLPVDPRIGRMILAADRENCLAEVLIIASLLELQDPRLRPPEQQGAADAAHARFNVPGSDFLAILKLWERYHELKESSSRSALPRACAQEFLSFTRLREWADVHRQLREMVESMGMRTSDLGRALGEAQPSLKGKGADPAQARADAIHRALLAGLLSHVAFRTEKYEYTGTGGKKFYLWPGSSLFEEKPKWIVAAELVETNRLYGRTVASINPDWLERLGSHLVKKHHSEPRWDPTHGRVSASERVTLLGLTIVPRRTVHFGPIDPIASREMFINHALVLGDWNPPHRARFWEHNLRMIEQVEALEAKTRTRDLLVDEAARYAFYDRRVPQGVFDVASFEKWRHEAERANPRILFMTEADLLSKEAPQGLEAFPDHVTFDGVKLPLEYHLEPGSEEDGVTVLCPLPALGQIDAKRLDWVVPGLLLEKVTELIRAMPKGLRKAFVPAPDVATKVVARLAFAEGELHEAISRVLKDLTGVEVPREAYVDDALPHHLRMNVRVLDSKGNVLAQGRDIVKIRAQLGVEAAASFAEDTSDDRYTRDGITTWDFAPGNELPAQVRVRRAGLVMTAYPTLIDKGDSVSLRLVDAPTRAAAEHRRGLRRLFALQVAREVKYHVEQSVPVEAVALQMSGAVTKADLKAQAIDVVIDRAFLWDEPVIRDAAAFQERLDAGWNRIADAAIEVGQRLKALASAYHQAALAVAKAPDAPQLHASLLDVRAQLSTLTAPGFVATTPYTWLVQYPRYLGGAHLRVQKLLNGGAAKDVERMAEFSPLWRQYLDRRNSHERQGIVDDALVTYRWMLEELRVSLFAQELGTSIPVSRKRLEKQWDRVRA